MTTTAFTNELSHRSAKPIYIVTIAGLGDSNGLYKFCTRVPEYAIGDDRYKPILLEPPSITGARVDLTKGGVPKRTQLSFVLLDRKEYETDPGFFTRQTRSRQDPIDVISGRIFSQTSNYFLGNVAYSSNPYTVGQLIHIGSETMRVDQVQVATGFPDGVSRCAVFVTRAQLGTRARVHDASRIDLNVYALNPFLLTRSCNVYMTFDALAEADEEPLARDFRIGDVDLRNGTLYEIVTTSNEGMLEREIYSGGDDFIVGKATLTGGTQVPGTTTVINPRTVLVTAQGNASDEFFRANVFSPPPATYQQRQYGDTYLMVDGKDVIRGRFEAELTQYGIFPPPFTIQYRDYWDSGVAAIGEPLERFTDKDCREVFTDRSFRFQRPGEEMTVRPTDMFSDALAEEDGSTRNGAGRASTGAWRITRHPALVLLCLMCSSRIPGDGLELTNYVAGKGNFSGLRPGLGIGIPADLIDFDSFWAMFDATASLKFRGTYIEKPERFDEWATKEVLGPLGWLMRSRESDGKIELARLRVDIDQTVTGTDIGPDDIVAEGKDAMGGITHDVTFSEVVSTVTLKLTDKSGRPGTELRFPQSATTSRFGLDDAAVAQGKSVQFDIKSIDVQEQVPIAHLTGELQALYERVEILLRRFNVPVDRVTFTTDLSFLNVRTGDLFFLTAPWLVNVHSSSRGWADVPMEVIRRSLDLDKGLIKWECIAFPGRRQRVIPPTVWVRDHNGGNTWLVHDNRFGTRFPGASRASDLSGFNVGDRVRLVNPDGSEGGNGNLEDVTSFDEAAGTITLGGNFGGVSLNNKIITWAPATEATITSTQLDQGAFMGTKTSTALVGSTPLSRFGIKLLNRTP